MTTTWCWGVVVPVLNESANVPALDAQLARLQAEGMTVIIVDGGSRDDTVAQLTAGGWTVLAQSGGRGPQLQAGCAALPEAVNAVVLLHADTQLPDSAVADMSCALDHRQWGRFDVCITGRHPMLRVIGAAMNLRSRLTGIATGDHTLFMRRSALRAVGGVPWLPLMEDLTLSSRLRRLGPPACLRRGVITSGRRWEQHGVWRTIWLMWQLRWAYWRGVPAAQLKARYR